MGPQPSSPGGSYGVPVPRSLALHEINWKGWQRSLKRGAEVLRRTFYPGATERPPLAASSSPPSSPLLLCSPSFPSPLCPTHSMLGTQRLRDRRLCQGCETAYPEVSGCLHVTQPTMGPAVHSHNTNTCAHLYTHTHTQRLSQKHLSELEGEIIFFYHILHCL